MYSVLRINIRFTLMLIETHNQNETNRVKSSYFKHWLLLIQAFYVLSYGRIRVKSNLWKKWKKLGKMTSYLYRHRECDRWLPLVRSRRQRNREDQFATGYQLYDYSGKRQPLRHWRSVRLNCKPQSLLDVPVTHAKDLCFHRNLIY